MGNILLKNADILIKKADKICFLRGAYLGVVGSYIDYIGKDKPIKKYEEEKDFSGMLLIPGLVNAHTHTPMTLLRGLGTGLPLDSWLKDSIYPVEDKMDTNDCIIGTQFAISEMLASGTTCYEDMYWNQELLAPMLLETGIKVNSGAVVQLLDPKEKWALDFAKDRLEATEHFVKEYAGKFDNRIIPNMQLHSEYLSDDTLLEKVSRLVHDYKLELHIHVSETKKEHEECIKRHGETPIAHLNRFGLLDFGGVCAHGTFASDEDLGILLETKSSLVHVPTSNLKLGSGIAPIAKAVNLGVNVCLGTDGTASNNNLNMFEEMHIASILQQGKLRDSSALSPENAFLMGSYNGSMALHRFDCGELAVGKRADVVAINMDKPHLLPDNDTLGLIVYSMQASDVYMTMVDGRILYENQEYFSIDYEKCKREFLSACSKLNK